LDGLRFYFLGRGGVLGDVEYRVIHSAFGYFAPAMVARMWDTARERTDRTPREVGHIYLECCRDFGRSRFGDVEQLDALCGAADRVTQEAHPAGLALFAGLAAEPLAEDLPGRVMQLMAVLRELRGSLHLLALVACEAEPSVAHFYRRPDDFVTFGYAESDKPVLDQSTRQAIGRADALTDRLMARIYARLTDTERDALADGVRRLADAAGPLH
jgi:hypothetical protein